MATRTGANTRLAGDPRLGVSAATITDGLLAGLAGGVTIAVWFFAYDLVMGRAFYTPTVLGAAIFRAGTGLDAPATLTPSLELVLPFTWVHLHVYCILWCVASFLLSIAERDANYGFGVLLLFVVVEFGFVLACQVLSESVLDALAWPAVLTGNLLAAVGMAAVLWRRHPRLDILP